MDQDFFSVELSSQVTVGIPLSEMGSVIQLEMRNICAVPGVGDFWYGVVNFKGSLLWVLDSDRFLDLSNQRKTLPKMLLAVIVKNPEQSSSQKIALVSQKLVGTQTLDPYSLRDLPANTPAKLRNCCSMSVEVENNYIYLLNSTNLLAQLKQQSALVSA